MWKAYSSTSSVLKKEVIKRAGGDTSLIAQERAFYAHATKQRVRANFTTLNKALHSDRPKWKAKALVLRAEGTNGHEELGFMFESAGFEVVYANMEEFKKKKMTLSDFQLLCLPGGFSFGDLLGSGVAWAMQFKNDPELWSELQEFIARPDTLIFAVCNGYQALMELDIMYQGSVEPEHAPRLTHNTSHMFEHHLSYLTIPQNTNVVFLKDMREWILPIYSAHGEGNHYFPDRDVRIHLTSQGRAPIRFAGPTGMQTQAYPANPNGSFHGIAGMASANGRIFGMMPHPERILLTHNLPYMPKEWIGKLDTYTPWIMIALNAYAWCLDNQKQ